MRKNCQKKMDRLQNMSVNLLRSIHLTAVRYTKLITTTTKTSRHFNYDYIIIIRLQII